MDVGEKKSHIKYIYSLYTLPTCQIADLTWHRYSQKYTFLGSSCCVMKQTVIPNPTKFIMIFSPAWRACRPVFLLSFCACVRFSSLRKLLFFYFAMIAAVIRFYSYVGDGIETAAGSCKKRTKRELISSDFLPDVFPELKNKTAQKKRNRFRTLAEGTERQRP